MAVIQEYFRKYEICCGNDFNCSPAQLQPDSDCNTACSGDPTSTCGGSNRIAVFEVYNQNTLSPSPSPTPSPSASPSCEAEYIAASDACKEAIWLKGFHNEVANFMGKEE
ncbi:hypothetical protein K491DRAFT_723770 [Lophiostoma macrostomum CBS 122681]|uniref:WSC domain-containing protein n=1 Tax=Lophiostoma macrostomum CBS 122681 TaxID=1314788 RepID=A0A6A6SJ70_9PLEO|nr:hypothetical protein K491DRAFT_723770 [Lophiostoma macrostomum CBS 122681]